MITLHPETLKKQLCFYILKNNKKKIKDTYNTSKRMKYLRVNLTKEGKDL